MILSILYHILPPIVHDWMYALWDKVIVRHQCNTCGRVWYRVGEPIFMFESNVDLSSKADSCMFLQVPRHDVRYNVHALFMGEPDADGDMLDLGGQSDEAVSAFKDAVEDLGVRYSHSSQKVWPTGNEAGQGQPDMDQLQAEAWESYMAKTADE